MANSGIKLLGSWASPFVLRTRIALNLKSVDYEFVQENLVEKSELLIKSNPVHKKVPVLLHGQRTVCESLVIVQYIDEVWSSSPGPAILPSDPYDRSVARFWAAYLDSTWFPLIKEIRLAKSEEGKMAAMEKVTDGLLLMEDAFDKLSNGKAFFGGDQIGYIDIALGGFLGWVKVTELMNEITILDHGKIPRLVKWADAFLADAAVKDIMPETPKLIEFANFLFARMNAAAH